MEDQTSVVRKRRHLSPEEKFQIFLEATMAKVKENGSVAEVLRRWGIHSSDLVRIKKTIEQSSLEAFRERKSRRPQVNFEEYQGLQLEKQRLETTILEQAAELALLKKKDRST
jgi:transposase-like protein